MSNVCSGELLRHTERSGAGNITNYSIFFGMIGYWSAQLLVVQRLESKNSALLFRSTSCFLGQLHSTVQLFTSSYCLQAKLIVAEVLEGKFVQSALRDRI